MIMIIDHGNIEDDNDATCRPMATALSRVRWHFLHRRSTSRSRASILVCLQPGIKVVGGRIWIKGRIWGNIGWFCWWYFRYFTPSCHKDQTDHHGENKTVTKPQDLLGYWVGGKTHLLPCLHQIQWLEEKCGTGAAGVIMVRKKTSATLPIKFHNTPSISLSGSFQSCTWGTLPGRPLSPGSAGRPPPSLLLPSWAPSTVFLLDLLFVYFQLSLIDVEVENPGFAQNPKPGPVPGGRCSFFVQIPGPGPGGLELSPSRWPSCTRSRALRWWATPSRGSRRCGRAFSVLRRVLIVWRTPQERPGHQIYKQHRTPKAEQI